MYNFSISKRSNSLRQGLPNIGNPKRKSSLEDIGLSHFSTSFQNPIKIALNDSIGLEVTPPEEDSPPIISSNTALVVSPPMLGGAKHNASTLSLQSIGGVPGIGELYDETRQCCQKSKSGLTTPSFMEPMTSSSQAALPTSSTDPQQLQGTIV